MAAKQDYGQNDEEITLLLGHDRESNGCNRTYNHATAERLLAKTERKLGKKDEPGKSHRLPRSVVYEEVRESHWQCCPVCGTQYGLS